MFAAGGLMGIRTGVSLMVGAIVNYLLLVPWAIAHGDVPAKVVDGVAHYGFKQITTWALWGGVAMMTTASLVAFFAKPQILVSAFQVFSRKRPTQNNVMRGIELPMKVFVVGIPVLGALVVFLAITTSASLGARGARHPADLRVYVDRRELDGADLDHSHRGLGQADTTHLWCDRAGQHDHQPDDGGDHGRGGQQRRQLADGHQAGYMLGGKPRQQAMGHVLGIVAGRWSPCPYSIYCSSSGAQMDWSPSNIRCRRTIWKAVAELLTQGLDKIPVSAQAAALEAPCWESSSRSFASQPGGGSGSPAWASAWPP